MIKSTSNDMKHQLIGKNLDARKDWRQKEKRLHGMSRLESITDWMERCCSPWGRKAVDMT